MLGDSPMSVVLLATDMAAWFIDPGKNCVGILQVK